MLRTSLPGAVRVLDAHHVIRVRHEALCVRMDVRTGAQWYLFEWAIKACQRPPKAALACSWLALSVTAHNLTEPLVTSAGTTWHGATRHLARRVCSVPGRLVNCGRERQLRPPRASSGATAIKADQGRGRLHRVHR